MNKEERYSHALPLDVLICTFLAYCQHTTQTLVIKPGKNVRLCYDASTTRLPTDNIMNQVTPFNSQQQGARHLWYDKDVVLHRHIQHEDLLPGQTDPTGHG